MLGQSKEDRLTDSVYCKDYRTVPVTAPWHLALLYLLVAATTKFRFSCVAVNVFESREDTRCLLESYLFSGGLADVVSSAPSQCFVHSLFDRPDDYAALHAWLDTRFPEPAWRRKRQPVDESLELRYLAVLTHLCRRDTLLLRCHEQLAGEGHERLPVPAPLETLWRQVLFLREHLRKKKQEFAAHGSVGFPAEASRSMVALPRLPSTALRRANSVRASIGTKNRKMDLRWRDVEAVKQQGEKEKEDNEKEDNEKEKNEKEKDEKTGDKDNDNNNDNKEDEATDADLSEPAFISSFDEYVEMIAGKLEVLMELEQPWDQLADVTDPSSDPLGLPVSEGGVDAGKLAVNAQSSDQDDANRENNGNHENSNNQNNTNNPPEESEDSFLTREASRLASQRRAGGMIVEEKGSIPDTWEELVIACLRKFLFVSSVSGPTLRACLRSRTANAANKAALFNAATDFLAQLEEYPQASRLFLLGLLRNMALFALRSSGGFHDAQRRREGAYGIDYLKNCEGAGRSALLACLRALLGLCEALKRRFGRCVDQQQWRLGTAILWFLATVSSPRLPFLSARLGLLPFLEAASERLSKWYEMSNDYSKDILISPGPFWDSLAERRIGLAQAHFHRMLRGMQETWEFLHTQSAQIPGIFPQSVAALANGMRLTYSIVLIQLFSDYAVRSRQSPAQMPDSLFHWTLTDVANLFLRSSPAYLRVARRQFDHLLRYLARQQRVLKERCDAWQPFAPISYRANESEGNPYSCVRVVDEKNIMRAMIATDMLISSGEALIAFYLALTLFLSRTRLAAVLDWSAHTDMLWRMLAFSPRHQKLTVMLFQFLIPVADCLPRVFDAPPRQFALVQPGTPDADSILKNPLLRPPHFSRDAPVSDAEREAFVFLLLHLVSHSDGCPGALVGERNSCALCCAFFPFIYNTLCRSAPGFATPNRDAYLEEVAITREQVFVASCAMGIRPDGHTAAFCSLVFAEEVVYLLRRMLETPRWAALMFPVFQQLLEITAAAVEAERGDLTGHAASEGFHVALRRRTPWFCMATAVLKVLGAITPRMYAGSRIRIHEFLMEGGNDGSTLIHAAYQSRGTGTIIKYHRAMGHALVLMDKVNAPRLINSYTFDVVDRVAPPSDRDGLFARLLEPIERLLRALALNEELFTLPAPEMPFFNTSDVCLSPAQLQNSILYLYCVRCVNHLVIGDETLALRLRRETVTQLWRTALRPLPCNVSFNTLIVRQYFNWFIEYLVDTYAGSARLLPMELQNEVDGEVIYGRDKVDPRFGFGKEEEEEVRFDEGEETDGPKVVRNEKRMKKAREVAGICNVDVMVAYAVLQVVEFVLSHVVSQRQRQRSHRLPAGAAYGHAARSLRSAAAGDAGRGHLGRLGAFGHGAGHPAAERVHLRSLGGAHGQRAGAADSAVHAAAAADGGEHAEHEQHLRRGGLGLRQDGGLLAHPRDRRHHRRLQR